MHRFLPRSFLLALAALAAFLSAGSRLAAQTDFMSSISDYFAHWKDRVEAAKAAQPDWITPLATTTPRLEEEFRYDQNRQTARNGSTTDIYGSGKGLELIPTEHIEVILYVPPYQVHRGPGPARTSGFGDDPGFLVKYRLLSANKQSGDYIVSIFAAYGFPTGALVNTSHNHVFTPTLAAGKGFGDFDIQATVGDAIPTQDHSKAGRSILSNVTFQYHVTPILWPELEINRTDWIGGARSSRHQVYLTPGVVFGRFVLSKQSKLILGLGYQTEVSRDYPTNPATPTFNHNWILSARVTF